MKIITVEEHFMSSKVNDKVKQVLMKDPNTNEKDATDYAEDNQYGAFRTGLYKNFRGNRLLSK